MPDEPGRTYRVAIRYSQGIQRYHIFQLEAQDLRDALSRACDRFPEAGVEAADLVEIRLAHPAGPA